MEDGKAGRRSELLTSRSVLSELDPATMSPAHQKQRSLPNVEEEAESVPPLDLDTKVTSFRPPSHIQDQFLTATTSEVAFIGHSEQSARDGANT